MNLPRAIAWRYLKRPADALVSAVGFVSILGLVIGVMALVISMALMTGYRRDLQRKLLGGNAEVFVYSVGEPIKDTTRLLQLVRSTPGAAEASPVLFLHALVTTERNSTGTEVMLKGIEPCGERTGHRYAVNDWRDMNRQLFSMLKIQQLVLFVVIGLIVFVSTFNIVSTLIMTVHEKRKEIGILTSMGAEPRMITRIFLWYGAMVGFVGTATGVILGVLVCFLITRFHLVSFPPDIAEVYFVSSIPFITRGVDLSVIAAFSLLVSFLATIVPSLRAARLNPVDALRHE